MVLSHANNNYAEVHLNNECWICGKKEAIPYKCRYCGKTFCADHRLPEQHACEAFNYSARDSFAGSSGGSGGYTQYSDTDDMLKDILKTSAKYAAKSAASGIANSTKRSISTSPSMAIIFICVVSFFLEQILGYGYINFFQLYPPFILARPWTIVTHIFLHGSLGHLFFNMLVLFFFGRELERRVGNRVFLNVFFTAGIVAALGYSLTGIAPMIGASGAIYGVFAAIAVLAPEMRVYVYFIPMRIKHALILFALIDFLMIGAPDMIAHTAHLSGILVGLIMGMRIKKTQQFSRTYGRRFQ